MLKMEKVHEDARGEIYVIALPDGKDIVINTTKKGYARGGCYHAIHDEHFMVLKGLVRLWIGEKQELYHEGMSEIIPKNSPHMMRAQLDSITIEWGSTREEKNTYDPSYRKMVENFNRSMEE